MLDYGVLKGPVVDSGREDDHSSPHFQIVILANGNRFRAAVNVESGDHTNVLFSIVDPLINHRLVSQLGQIPEGFSRPGQAQNFLDFLREPIFDITAMRSLPASASGPDNDLQDFVSHKIEMAKQNHRLSFVFGAQFPGGNPRPADNKFHTNGGIHEIHMNQGNPVGGGHDGENGIHQDGGLIIENGDGSFAGIFMAFQSQLLPTDNAGRPLPGAQPILAAPSGGNNASQAADLSIVAACVNPVGADPGLETVILVNTSSTPVNLSAFAIEDKQGKREALQGLLNGGDVIKIRLSGQGAQLSNNGGSIRLVRVGDGGIVHSVAYTSQGASVQGRTLVF